jgi:hypothetical protein
VRGTLTLCANLGLTASRGTGGRMPIRSTAVVEMLGAKIIFHGRVRDIDRRTVGGFARGSARFEGVEDWRGHTFKLDFQNEFLMAERDGEILVTTPELITLAGSRQRQSGDGRFPEIRLAAGGAGLPLQSSNGARRKASPSSVPATSATMQFIRHTHFPEAPERRREPLIPLVGTFFQRSCADRGVASPINRARYDAMRTLLAVLRRADAHDGQLPSGLACEFAATIANFPEPTWLGKRSDIQDLLRLPSGDGRARWDCRASDIGCRARRQRIKHPLPDAGMAPTA